AIYEGLLPICANEAGLAVVLSHEIAHVLARHGAERMSQKAVVRGVGGVLDTVTREQEVPDQEKIFQIYGVASHLGVILPYSRKHEMEADSIGLTLMARAGYDPREAPRFWERFAAASGGQSPEFLSTHPSDSRRRDHLNGLLNRAMTYYEHAESRSGLGAVIPELPQSARVAARAQAVPQVQAAADHVAPIGPTSAVPAPAADASTPLRPSDTDAPTTGEDSDGEWELPRRTNAEPQAKPPTRKTRPDGWVPTGRTAPAWQ
ncbi:MAG: M48 family metallopeptidase, partial [Maioricimonas sp. JB049]